VSKPAPAAPAPKAAPPSPAAKASDPGLEERVAALETIVAGFAEMFVTKQRFDVYLAGYTGDEASWEFSADPESAGPSFKPDEATIEDLRLYVWQYSDGDYTQDEKALRKLAKSIKSKGDLKLSNRAKESALPPLEGAVEAQEEEAEQEEAEEEATCALGVDDVDTATIDQIREAAISFGIDLKLYGKGKEGALRAIVKKNIAEALAAQEGEEETTEETEEEAQTEEFSVEESVLVYPLGEDGSPDTSQEALQGKVTAIGDPDGEGDRPHTVRFGADMLDAAKEAFGDNCKVIKKGANVVGVSITLPSAGWLTRPAE
jgi:hypothetical protein